MGLTLTSYRKQISQFYKWCILISCIWLFGEQWKLNTEDLLAPCKHELDWTVLEKSQRPTAEWQFKGLWAQDSTSRHVETIHCVLAPAPPHFSCFSHIVMSFFLPTGLHEIRCGLSNWQLTYEHMNVKTQRGRHSASAQKNPQKKDWWTQTRHL